MARYAPMDPTKGDPVKKMRSTSQASSSVVSGMPPFTTFTARGSRYLGTRCANTVARAAGQGRVRGGRIAARGEERTWAELRGLEEDAVAAGQGADHGVQRQADGVVAGTCHAGTRKGGNRLALYCMVIYI